MLHESLRALSRWVAAALLVLATASGSAQVDELQRAGREGQDLGHALIEQAPEPGYSAGGERQQGSVHVADTTIPVNQLQAGGDTHEQERLKSLEGNETALQQAGANHLASIAGDSSAASQSLRLLAASPDANPQQTWATEQSTLAQSVLALTTPRSIAPDFPACTPSTTVTPSTQTYQRAHTRICERVHRPESCVRTQTLLDASDQDWQVLQETLTVDTLQTRTYALRERLDSGVTPVAMLLDVTVDDDRVTVSVLEAPSLSNDWTTIVQLEPIDSTCAEGCNVHFNLHGKLRALRQVTNSEPTNCLLDQDTFCRADFQCEESTLPVLNGSELQANEALALAALYPPDARHLPADPRWPVCTRASARYHCEIQTGSFCTAGPNGQICVDQTDANTLADTCAPMLQTAPQCQLQSSRCTEGAMADADWCYVESITYNCPETLIAPSATIVTTQPCAGQIRCAGDDCLDTRDQESSLSDLADGMAGMMIAQVFASDWQHESPSRDESRTEGEPVPTGRLFPGRAYECRKALGGTVSCCDETETNVEAEWFARYQRHIRRGQAKDSQIRYGEQGAHGSWKILAEQDQHALADLQQPLTSGPETVTAGLDTALDPDPGTTVGSSRELTEMNQEFTAEQRYQYLDDIGYACSTEELDLAIQRELGHCLPVGSYCHHQVLGACLDKRDVYCCFNSAASAEVRASIARDNTEQSQPFGSARDPDCRGLLVAAARPRSVDLGQLKARLAAADLIPDARNILARSNADRLTGSGSQLADETRPTTQQRTAMRMDQINGGRVRDHLQAEAATLTPALTMVPTPGQIAFAPAYVERARNRAVSIHVNREGELGDVTVGVVVHQVLDDHGQPLPPSVVGLSVDQVHWQDGESGLRAIAVMLPKDFVGRITLALQQPSGGAVLYPNEQAQIRILP